MSEEVLNQFQFTPPEGPVYHGSGHGFSPGDTIHPTPDRNHMGGESAAFGVTNMSTAGYFGIQGTSNVMEHGGVQGRLFASVYEVGPKSRYERHPSQTKSVRQAAKYDKSEWNTQQRIMDAGPNTMPIDRQGFEVKRHAAFALPVLHKASGTIHEEIQETPHG